VDEAADWRERERRNAAGKKRGWPLLNPN